MKWAYAFDLYICIWLPYDFQLKCKPCNVNDDGWVEGTYTQENPGQTIVTPSGSDSWIEGKHAVTPRKSGPEVAHRVILSHYWTKKDEHKYVNLWGKICMWEICALYAMICEWMSIWLYVYEYRHVISLWLSMWYIYVELWILVSRETLNYWKVSIYVGKFLPWQSMKCSEVLEMHWYMIIVHVTQGF